MELTTLYMIIGFSLASYSVIANDSVQTLGTWIASNSKKFSWYTLWIAASTVLLFTLWYGWNVNDGDIAYRRLERIPYQTVQWYHAVAPLILVVLTRYGVPVSTTFLVLSSFASTVILEKVLLKSAMGYIVAAAAAYVIWLVVSRFWENRKANKEHDRYWRVAQWCTTGWLWFTWLSHDMANIAVFLPRQIDAWTLAIVSAVFVAGLGFMFHERGGRIQEIVLSKSNTTYVRSATLVDLIYSIILWYFKGYNNIPMSTTWVFVGLLAGRELAFATAVSDNYKFKAVFPLVRKDFFKMMIGLALSIAIVLAIHGFAFDGLANI